MASTMNSVGTSQEATSAPLSDVVIVAVAQLVDDSQSERRRDPSHSDLDFLIKRAGVTEGDPKNQGQTVGKAKRVRATLSWALDEDPARGSALVKGLIDSVRGYGGFRESSPNFVGRDAIETATTAFEGEGYELSADGQLRSILLDNLSGAALTTALRAYAIRAKRGAGDADLVTSTGKDLLEATAAHVIQERFGTYSTTSNFPTLLGQAFVALGLATPHDAAQPGESASKRVERAMYEFACAINQLRNKQGAGHGRPWAATISDSEAKLATEAMGVIAERLLALQTITP